MELKLEKVNIEMLIGTGLTKKNVNISVTRLFSYTVADKPSAPTGPLKVSEVTEDSVDLEWKPPQSDGGSPITHYCIEVRDVRRSTWTKVADVKATATKYTVGKLSVDNEYMFRVIAVNAEGDSPPLTTPTTTAPVKKLSKCLYCFGV